jgi:hypothetical protein
MKATIIISGLALFAVATFTSCKKNYTCTCTTVVGSLSGDVKHDINNSSYTGAKKLCNEYQDQSNATYPGSTACRL